MLGALGLAGGCFAPPVNVGYVAMDPSRRGGVDVQGQIGGGGALPRDPNGGGAAMHVEPFVTPKVSIPIGTGIVGSTVGGAVPLRVGVRHRATRFFAYGAGIGPGVSFLDGIVIASGTADIEFIFGLQRHWGGFSVGLRPAVTFDSGLAFFYTMVDPTLALAITPRTSLTLALPMGASYLVGSPPTPFLTGAIGLFRRF
jgi:hypothetical protein